MPVCTSSSQPLVVPSIHIVLPDILAIQPCNLEPEKSSCPAFPQHMPSQSCCVAIRQIPDFNSPHAKSDRKLRKGKGHPYRRCDIYKMDRLEEDLLFKTDTIRVALPLQAQASVTLTEELENGCRDSKSRHGRTRPLSLCHKGLHHWFAVHFMLFQ